MKRVLIFARNPLLGKCVETLLGRAEQVEIVACVNDVDVAIERIRAVQPDVVIVDSDESDANRGKIMLRVMKEGLKARFMELSLRDNKVFVCNGEQKVIQELDDFVGMVTSKNAVPSESASAVVTPFHPVVTQDPFGRILDYLRISITDRCNLRCVYCMPTQGIESKPREVILHSEEIARIVEAAANIGFHSVRLTGGEPLVRKGVVGLVRRLATIPGISEVSMTTNGTLLGPCARELAKAGLKRVNISLDTLEPERFRRITRVGNLQDAWEGIAAAEAAGLAPLKINTVVIRGFNDDEIVDLARLTLEHPWHVRFIQLMPAAGVPEWGEGMPEPGKWLVTVEEMRQRLQVLGPLLPDEGPAGHGPARYYRLQKAKGTLGFISPVGEHFCASCNRLRLTADGYLHPCLFSEQGVYCRPALSDGASLRELGALIQQAVNLKPERHPSFAAAATQSTPRTSG